MGVRPRRLSAKQELLLTKVQQARKVKVEKELTVREDVELEIQERLKQYDELLLQAIEDAVHGGVSKAAIMRAYGTTDYRTVQNYIDRVAERDAFAAGAVLQRFVFDSVSVRGEIVALDIETGELGRFFIGEWKNDWEHNVHGVRGGKLWDAVPELELFVDAVDAGRVVPAELVASLERPIRERLTGGGSSASGGVLGFD